MTTKINVLKLSAVIAFAAGDQESVITLANSLPAGLYRLDWHARIATEINGGEQFNLALASANVTGEEENALTKDGQPWTPSNIGSSTEGSFRFETVADSPLALKLNPGGNLGGTLRCVVEKLD